MGAAHKIKAPFIAGGLDASFLATHLTGQNRDSLITLGRNVI